MHLVSPARVIAGVLFWWEHKSQAAIPLIPDDLWSLKVRPAAIQLVRDRRIVQVGWTQQVLHDFAIGRHPRMELEAVELALSRVPPPCTCKTTTLRSFGSADWYRCGIDHRMSELFARHGEGFELFKQLFAPLEGLGVTGQTWTAVFKHRPPDRELGVLEHQAAEQERDQHRVAHFLVRAVFGIAKVLFGPAMQLADDFTLT